MLMKKTKNKKSTKKIKLSLRDKIILLSLLVVFVAGLSISDIMMHQRLSDVIDKTVLGLKVGELSTKDVIAEETVYYIDADQTTALQQEAAESILPVFRVSLSKALTTLDDLESIRNVLTDEQADTESKIKWLQEENLDDLFTGDDLQTILSYSVQDSYYLFSLIEELLIQLYEVGIYDSEELSRADDPSQITLIRISSETHSEAEEQIIDVEELLTIESMEHYIESLLVHEQDYLNDFKETVLSMVGSIAQKNIIYDSITTEKRRIEASQNISPVINKIEQGELILKEGFLVTESDYKRIRALEQVEISQSPLEMTGRILYYLLITIVAAVSLLKTIPKTQRRVQYLYLSISFILVYLILYVFGILKLYSFNITQVASFAPIVLFSMLLTIIISRNASLIITGFLVAITLAIPDITFIEALFILTVGILGSFVVQNAKRRIDLVTSALTVSLLSVLVLGITAIIENMVFRELLGYLGYTFSVNLVSGLLVIIILPILEHFFNLPTGFRLIELTTMNSKTLKRMAVMARGSYSHSVAVADLAESACEAIGANHLLARVGAYYHDIGKIDQPEYFIENQTGDNKHDEIKPSLSVVVIKSHVKLGIEKAKSIGLPQEVIDIIAQHHGSDLISYFYREALMNNEKGSKVSPEDFSYTGTPPMSKEAAVVMLADSIDAASRTLKQPTTAKMEKLIWKIFLDKIDRRQLIHCELSLHDLETIKNSFIIILAGRFHTRIEYPDIPDEVIK